MPRVDSERVLASNDTLRDSPFDAEGNNITTLVDRMKSLRWWGFECVLI